MQPLTSTRVPSYDEKTDAVLLYSEKNLTVLSVDKTKTRIREAYRILRPEGREHGEVFVYFHSPAQKVTSLHGWCIPAQGKVYEVKEKDAVDLALPGVPGGELIDDVKAKLLRIPAPDPGNIIGYEYEVEEKPFVLQDIWYFQHTDPVRESHYSLQLPEGWEYRASWLNHPEIKPTQSGSNEWNWAVADLKELRREPEMPPLAGVEGQMIVTFFAAGSSSLKNGYTNWKGMGDWYSNLVGDRVQASGSIREQVSTLTVSKTSALQKMQALADFVQHDIRYVAIELGIGGWQPHSAADIFAHRYGDCKDKATLMQSMLHEVGIDSYYVVINTRRGAITPGTPANNGFNHMILAIRLPDTVTDPSLIATLDHPKLKRILFFDPTDTITPFGQIRGDLQANYGLLVGPDGGELMQLPQQPTAMNSIQRTAKLTLDPTGVLKGKVQETRVGDRARIERHRLLTVNADTERLKTIENLLGGSLSSFQITQATLVNLEHTEKPFGINYSFESDNYAKSAGNLLLVRPCVIGRKSQGFLETKEPRRFPVEFEAPVYDTDSFEFSIPAGYDVDDLPAPVEADYSFASYHSKTEVTGSVIRYTRTFEIKELSVPAEKTEDLRKFYRLIATDERSTMVLKGAAK